MSILEILQKARALIADPEHWTRGVSARTRHGIPCTVGEGHSFCAIGALDRAMAGVVWSLDQEFPHDILRKAIGTLGIADWNDRSNHVDVLAGFDKAIELARQ